MVVEGGARWRTVIDVARNWYCWDILTLASPGKILQFMIFAIARDMKIKMSSFVTKHHKREEVGGQDET